MSFNSVFMTGKKTYFQVFDPKGKPYTSMWLRVETENSQNVLVVVDLNEKTLNSPKLKSLEEAFASKEVYVLVTGEIRVDKNGSARIKANLNSVFVVPQLSKYSFNAYLTGKSVYHQDQQCVELSYSYRNPKTEEWLDRTFHIYVPQQGTPEFDSLNANALTNLPFTKQCGLRVSVFTHEKTTYLNATDIYPIY